MAKFILKGSKTVTELKTEFNEAFGSKLRVYNKNRIAEESATLGEIGLKANTEFGCRSSRTVGSFNAAFDKMGLKVKVCTKDEWQIVPDGITLKTSGSYKEIHPDMSKYVCDKRTLRKTKPIISDNMAKFNLTGSKTVAEFKKEFNEAFGSCINVYNGRNKAEDSETLGNLGLKADTEFECRSSRTVGSFKVAFAKMGLKVKVFTKDNWVAVLDGITLETSGKIPNQSTTEKMKEFLAYKREEKNSVEDLGDSQIYAKLDFDEIWIAREPVSESDVIDRYQKGKQEIFKQAIRNAIYDSCNDTVEIGWQLGEKIDFENGHGAIYADNVYEEKVTNDRGFSYTIVKYKFPCTILVVADGKIIDKMIFENAPETHEGYLFSDISYLYDLDELKDRLDCDDTEWFEEDMISLMNDVEEDDDWTRSYEIGDCGDGLYVSDLENYFYSVVIDGEIVFGWDE